MANNKTTNHLFPESAPKTQPDPGQVAYKHRTKIDEIHLERELIKQTKEVWDDE